MRELLKTLVLSKNQTLRKMQQLSISAIGANLRLSEASNPL